MIDQKVLADAHAILVRPDLYAAHRVARALIEASDALSRESQVVPEDEAMLMAMAAAFDQHEVDFDKDGKASWGTYVLSDVVHAINAEMKRRRG